MTTLKRSVQEDRNPTDSAARYHSPSPDQQGAGRVGDMPARFVPGDDCSLSLPTDILFSVCINEQLD